MSNYRTFDDWFHEQEGFGLRSERFSGDIEWLKAAFEAGQSARTERKMTGFLDTLTDEQLQAALEYRGDDNHPASADEQQFETMSEQELLDGLDKMFGHLPAKFDGDPAEWGKAAPAPAIAIEKIVAAAHLIAGITYSMPQPARHHTILHAMDDHIADLALHAGPASQGFLTSTGRFVSREAAASIAVAAGQIDKPKFNSTQLFSEDLW